MTKAYKKKVIVRTHFTLKFQDRMIGLENCFKNRKTKMKKDDTHHLHSGQIFLPP